MILEIIGTTLLIAAVIFAIAQYRYNNGYSNYSENK